MQLGDDGGRGLLDAGPAHRHAGIDADRFHCLAAGHLRDVQARGATPQKHTPLTAHRLPCHGRGRGRGALGHKRLVNAARGARVHALGMMAEEADAAAQDHVRCQEEDDDNQDRDAHEDGRQVRHVAVEHRDEHATEAIQGCHDRDQRPRNDDGTRGSQEVFAEGLARHVDEPGGDAGTAVGLDDGVEPPDREEGGDAHPEADLDRLGCADRQAGHGDDTGTHVLDDDAGDVAAGDEDARGDRVPRPGARHQRRRHAHRIHGERRDHSQKRHTHGPHCARRGLPVQERNEARTARHMRPTPLAASCTSRASRAPPCAISFSERQQSDKLDASSPINRRDRKERPGT